MYFNFSALQALRAAGRIMSNRAGFYYTNLSGEAQYKSFVPNPLPPNPPVELNNTLVKTLVEANSSLAVLESISSRIPSMKLFVSMYVRKEALMSSQIEGTQATLEDVLDPMIEGNANRNVADVVNYVNATEFAIERLKTLPLCNRLIKETHAVLMKNVGEFRYSQNWIGSQGSTIRDAKYIPPNPQDMETAMSDLEKYINSEDNLDCLIRAALIHYQFETIHPFLDGNGRVGRLLITLFLMEKKILSSPVLYISYFLKKNRLEYYDRMTAVRETGNYEQWILFFLTAIRECAQDAIDTIEKLSALNERNTALINGFGRARTNVGLLFAFLESNPIIDIGKTANALGLSFNTVSSAVNRLVNAGILVKTDNSGRNRTFAYGEYLNILRKGT